MSERTPSYDATSTARSDTGLASPVAAVAFEAVPDRDRSLAATLCVVAGEIAAVTGSSPAPSPRSDPSPGRNRTPVPDCVIDAVTSLEGYARIRRDLVVTDRYDRLEESVSTERLETGTETGTEGSTNDRDAAVLASDYLHAAAYAAAGEAPVPARRSLELYRILAAGSTTLSHEFLERTACRDEHTGPVSTDAEGYETNASETGEWTAADSETAPFPMATVVGVAAELGATVVGTNETVRSSLETYGRSLAAALVARSSRSSVGVPRPIDEELLTTAVRELSGESDQPDGIFLADSNDESPSAGTATVPTDAVEVHLQRAHDAIGTLERAIASDIVADAGSDDDSGPHWGTEDRSPLVRLERATRIPFHVQR
ncbi:hypothetical protein [Halobiforma nitratireducens]|uniref:Polyprenyl synthetase n=1 Tax=Halobiforma nitratireducens JCM 10879 TaxID=1227454 RepID=M0LIX2_9EURY|nr:hypothetical protein [Halobiforma nitratireducens]EMA32384.1 hypothetical protein C446_14769 [Halobiforma nitratireducens JCM 10879]